MRRHELTDEQWARIEHLLPGRPGGHGGVARDNRLFVNAVWFVAKTGIQWRDLPERFGKWDTAYHRFNEWCKKGVWQRVLAAVGTPTWVASTRQHGRPGPSARGRDEHWGDDQALGCSAAGSGPRLAVDALGNPVALHLSPGQDADVTHAETLLGDMEPDAVVGNKGYDSDALAATIQQRGAEVVIPPKKNRTAPREYDKVLYKERNKVERCVGLFKQFRRVATRYEKTARNFLGMATLAAIAVWLR